VSKPPVHIKVICPECEEVFDTELEYATHMGTGTVPRVFLDGWKGSAFCRRCKLSFTFNVQVDRDCEMGNVDWVNHYQ
jgi:hypothetical protein